ncbi:hypothetical protein F4777DRAFT_211394 [Nemania sp. FL0916]|nr:hypothetical protein F4777DRAFT_211394 [Nemania sp. FL0916]
MPTIPERRALDLTQMITGYTLTHLYTHTCLCIRIHIHIHIKATFLSSQWQRYQLQLVVLLEALSTRGLCTRVETAVQNIAVAAVGIVILSTGPKSGIKWRRPRCATISHDDLLNTSGHGLEPSRRSWAGHRTSYHIIPYNISAICSTRHTINQIIHSLPKGFGLPRRRFFRRR